MSPKDVVSTNMNPNHVFMDYISKHTKIDPKLLANWFQTQGIMPPNSSSLLKPSNDELLTGNSVNNSPQVENFD